MESVHLYVFDLDGTLVDSAGDIAGSVNVLRRRLGLPALPLERVRGNIGEGVRRLLERSLPEVSAGEMDDTVQTYREIYRSRLLDETRPYPGVRETLEHLDEGGRELAVLTNKPLQESLRILEGLSLRRYFRHVYGGDSFERRKPDPTGLLHIVREAGCDRASTLFVGDSPVDHETARRAGVACCLVSYGIGAEQIQGLVSDHRVDDLRELVPALVPPRSSRERKGAPS